MILARRTEASMFFSGTLQFIIKDGSSFLLDLSYSIIYVFYEGIAYYICVFCKCSILIGSSESSIHIYSNRKYAYHRGPA